MIKNIAVLLPIYNGDSSEWFQIALDSVLNQKLPDYYKLRVYLGVDGPIGEDLEKVIQKNSQNLFKVVKSEKNIFLAGILNKLIKSLDAEEFVFRMDADDICMPGKFTAQIEFLTQNPEIDILGTAIQEVAEDGTTIGRTRIYYEHHDKILKNMPKGTAVAHPAVCFRGSSMSKIGLYNESMKKSQDIELWFRCFEAGLIFHNLQKPYLLFRCSEKTMKQRSLSKAWQEYHVYRKGVHKLFGISIKQFYPLARLCTRLLPNILIQKVYKSTLREKLFSRK